MSIQVNSDLHTSGRVSAYLSNIVLKLIGWKIDSAMPPEKKIMLIAVPHTSNWDLPLMLFIARSMGVQLNWVAKDTLFKGLFGRYMRWLGGIPVNRRSRTNFTDQVIDIYNKREKLIIVVAPAGTRSYTEYWKSGFYHIARGAKIPVAFGYLDYGRKIGGIKPGFMPTGNIDADLEKAREFYKDMTGKNPEWFGPIRIKPSSKPQRGNEQKPQP